MDAVTNRNQAEKLRMRRNQLAAALRELGKAPGITEQNPDWVDQAADETTADVIDLLKKRYLAAIDDVDAALDRIQMDRYGLCLACHQPVEPHRLGAAPETKYCSDCQQTREGLQKL